MKLIEAEKAKDVIHEYFKSLMVKDASGTDVDRLAVGIGSCLKHDANLLKAIDELPSAEPDTTTHESIPAKTGGNDGDRTSGDCISRQATYLAMVEKGQTSKRYKIGETWELSGEEIREVLDALPSAEPKRGKWILDRSGQYCCDKCMEPCAGYVMMRPRDKFCKICGSRNEVTE